MQTKTTIEVRYPDCDMMQVVHHSIYPVWYESARMDFFRKMGFSFSDMNKLSVNPAVVDLHLQFKAPATYPQTLTVVTKIGTFAPRKLQLVYEIFNESGKIINTAETFHIWVGPDGRAYNIEENLPDVYEKIKKAAG
ncbi:MAG: acyl-CoA thioesterase [Oscillospiraceae bacterium]|nr:acyl-CoA thioesterase [Oscillospiraceae bacterium]